MKAFKDDPPVVTIFAKKKLKTHRRFIFLSSREKYFMWNKVFHPWARIEDTGLIIDQVCKEIGFYDISFGS